MRWIGIIVASIAALWVLRAFFPKLAAEAFNVGGFGITYTMLGFVGLCFAFHKFFK
jgi:hypothetical protein